MNPNIAYIVYASDDRFAEILCISLMSLYETSANMKGIAIYIFGQRNNRGRQRQAEQLTEEIWKAVKE